MDSRIRDLTGQKFGRLTVSHLSEKRINGHACWVCNCDCGNIKIVCGHDLTHGTSSCGCLASENGRRTIHFAKRAAKSRADEIRMDPAIIQARDARKRLKGIYNKMQSRCGDPKNHRYKDYGGRGICVCDDWKNNFELFYQWALENDYSKYLTLDRRENNRGYSPDNCRWVTPAEQSRNMRNNRWITINGKTKIIADWCSEYGVYRQTFERRIKRGWSGTDLLYGRTNRAGYI